MDLHPRLRAEPSGRHQAGTRSGVRGTMATAVLARTAWVWVFHQPYLLLTLTTLAWAGNAVASRLAAGHISPMALTALRWVGVVVLLAPFMTRPIRAAAPVLVPIWRRVLVMGGLGFTAFNALMYAAAYHTTAVNIAIFQGAVPVFVLIFGLVAFGTRIGLLQALGTALTLVGVGAIAARGDVQVLASFSFLIGDVFMLIACASYAVYTLALRDRPKVSGFVFFSVLALAALMISLPLLAWEIAAGEVIWPICAALRSSSMSRSAPRSCCKSSSCAASSSSGRGGPACSSTWCRSSARF